jgi:hypothetical protein
VTVDPPVTEKSVAELTQERLSPLILSGDPRLTLLDGNLQKVMIGGNEFDLKDWLLSADAPGVWEK